MNVAFTVIFVLEIVIAFIRTEAFPYWSWGTTNKHKRWNHHHSETYHSCAVGQCVEAWKCPKPALAAESEKDSCIYRENGPWVCCLNDDSYHYYSSETSNNFKPTTIKPLEVRTIDNKQISAYDKYDGNPKPQLKHTRNRDEEEGLSHIRPLESDRGLYPLNKPKNKTIGTKIPNINVTNGMAIYKSTNSTTYKRTTTLWNKPRTSTSNPIYYKTTTNSWNKPRTLDSRIVFPTEKVTKYIAPTPPTKRISTGESWLQSTSTKAPWKYTTPHARRTVSVVTKQPSYSKKSTISTNTSTRKWNYSTTPYPARAQTSKPKTTRHSSNRFTTVSTRRYSVTTPLPNVNIHLCGIRDERTIVRRQSRDSNHEHNPVGDTIYFDNSRSRGRLPYQRIVGGEEVEPLSWPWVAALYKVTSSGGNRFLSAGSLINENFILTAAHVFTSDDLRTSSYVVMLGTHDAQDAVAQYIVSSVLLHPNYEHRYYYNDIALLKLERKVIFNNYIMPICLPSSNAPLHSDKDLFGKNVTVMGWGDDSFGGKSSQVLKKASFPIVSRVACNASYVRVASNRFPKGITAEMLCAGDPKGGKDACQGDSGGPLTVIENGRYTQVGIVSFGYKCGDKEFPGVYTKVAPYLRWIADNSDYADSLDYSYY